MSFKLLIIFIILSVCRSNPDVDIQILQTTEAFFTPLWLNKTTIMKNSGTLMANNFEVMASLSGHADLPDWMRYFQRINSSVGYLYGTPPKDEDGDIEIDIIILNKYNFNITSDRLKYRILNREEIYQFEVEIKFFDMDLQDFFERNLMTTVEEIFSQRLWNNIDIRKKNDDDEKNERNLQIKNSTSVYLTKVARPVDVGGRFPLDPNEKECVIVRIGSNQNFTQDLLRLENEVKQIKNRDPCPKRYKATMVEYVFRERRLYVDWCSFKLIRS